MSDWLNKVLMGASVGAGLLAAVMALKAARTHKLRSGPNIFKSYNHLDPVLNYIMDTSVRLQPAQEELIKVTLEHPHAFMMGSSEQLQFLSQLVKNMGAKKTLDIGVFTGYSAVAIALVLPPDGRVVACDVSDEYASIGKPYWKQAGVDQKIDLRIAPAAETLQSLLDAGEAGTYDFAFIDANKFDYPKYYEISLQLLRHGGIIAIDNLLWRGKVADPEVQDEVTGALREMNALAAADPRVMYSLLRLGDGTGLAFKL